MTQSAAPKNYKILSLRAENIKRLSVVEITPNGSLIEITGRNRQGKTSVLDAMWWLFEGDGNVQGKPIRVGEDSASVTADLGGIKVTRTFKVADNAKGYTTKLLVENDEGMKAGSPQELLTKLIGKLSFDPLAFAEGDAKSQVQTLRSFVPGVDFDLLDKANKDDFSDRTEVNRTVASLKANIAAFALPEVLPEAMDEAAILAELEGASAHNSDIERRKAAREAARKDHGDLTASANAARQQAAKLLEEAEALEAQAQPLAAKLAAASALPEPVDPAAISARLQSARSISEILAAAKAKAALEGQLVTAEDKATRLTNAMDERKATAAKAITDAKLPIPGLALGDGVVTLDGLPFDQASDADQLRVSVALAAAANPRLRVARVREGSRFDSETLAMVAALAEEHDIQLWVETVDSGRPQAIVIVDGHVSED